MLFYLTFLLLFNNLISDKICVNCIHYRPNLIGNSLFGKCSAFKKEEEIEKKIDYLVTGKKNIDFLFCVNVRKDENLCGLQGKYFSKKCFIDFSS